MEAFEPFEDEDVPLYTVGQVAQMLAVKQAFLRRVDDLQVVSPQRSPAASAGTPGWRSGSSSRSPRWRTRA